MLEESYWFESNTTVPYKGTLFTKEALTAIQAVERDVESRSLRLTLAAPGKELLSLGRFVRVCVPGMSTGNLWSLLIARGFTPWLRYPVEGAADSDLFVYHGSWQGVYDRLMVAGLGELAFPSLCVAFQCGLAPVEPWAMVGALLHLRGLDAGPLVGSPRPTYYAALAGAGVFTSSNPDWRSVARQLASSAAPLRAAPSPHKMEGSITFRGDGGWNCQTAGSVSVVRGSRNVRFQAPNGGRIVIDLIPGK